MRLTEFCFEIAELCIEKVKSYSLDKKSIGRRSRLFGTYKTGIQMTDLGETSTKLVDFFTEAIQKKQNDRDNKNKKLDSFTIALAFGMAKE